jgi:small subunit ribosomal protein S19|tara:strand:+ start:2110 stop:2514 length:405 start_codon:yes stop_codon:yes gene_type:complete
MTEEVIVRTKEKKYRGQTLEHLQSLGTREVSKYLPSRSRRSILRHGEVIDKFIKVCEEKIEKNKRIRTHLRDIVIVPKMVGMRIGIHNGRAFNDVEITLEMIGHRLGEFAMTRVRAVHTSAGIGATKGSRTKKK